MKPQHRSIKYVRDRGPTPRYSQACISAVTRALAPTSAGYRASPGSRLDFARIADSARWAEVSIAAVSVSMFVCSAYAALSGPCR